MKRKMFAMKDVEMVVAVLLLLLLLKSILS